MKRFVIENGKKTVSKHNSPLTPEDLFPGDAQRAQQSQFPRNTPAESVSGVSAQPSAPEVSKVQETTAVVNVPESTAVTVQETNNLALVVPTGKAVIPITPSFYKPDAPNQLTIRRNNMQKTVSNTQQKEDLLDSLESVSRLPLSPVKPRHLSDREYLNYCLVATMQFCKDMGMPPEQYIALGQLMRGDAGTNIAMISSIAWDTKMFQGPVDFSSHFTPEYLKNLEEGYGQQMKQISIKKNPMTLYEVKAAEKINKDFSADKLVLTREKDKSKEVGYYNNTPNQHPDYVVVLAEPTPQGVEQTAQDLKVGQQDTNRDKDSIRSGTDDLAISTKRAQQNVYRHVSGLLNNDLLSPEDAKLAEALKEDLIDNMAATDREPVNVWVSSFNRLSETHREILCTLRIGMQLQTQISIQDMNINPKFKELFVEKFKHFYTSPESELQSFLNKQVYEANRSMAEHHHSLCALARFLGNPFEK